MDERLEDLIPFYALDALTDDEKAQVEAYLAANPEARARLDEAAYAVSALAYEVEPVQPSPRLKQAVMEEFKNNGRTSNISSDISSTPPPSRPARFGDFLAGRLRRRLVGPALAALSLLLVIVLGIWVVSLKNQVAELRAMTALLEDKAADDVAPLQQELTLLRTEIETLRQENAALTGDLTAQDQTLEALGADMALLRETTRLLEEKLAGQSQRLVSLDSRLEGLAEEESRLAVLETELSAQDDLLASLQAELSRLQAENEALLQELSAQREVMAHATSPNVQPMALMGTAELPEAQGQLLANPAGETGVLIVSGLPPLEPGFVYKFWLVQDNQLIPSGVIDRDPRGLGTLVVTPEAAISSFDGMGVSVEPAGETQQPPNEMIMLGTLS